MLSLETQENLENQENIETTYRKSHDNGAEEEVED